MLANYMKTLREGRACSVLHNEKTINITEKMAKEKIHKGDDGKKKTQTKKKGKSQNPINYNETASAEFDKLEESEDEKGEEKEPPFNLENESKEVLRASWKNEMETHIDKPIPRITTRHFKNIRGCLNLVMSRVTALFRMINDTDEKDEEYIRETYTYGSFLLLKHIQDKIGEKLNKGNVYRRIPEKRISLKDEIEGKDGGKALNKAKYKADKLENILAGLKARIAYLQEVRNAKIYDEVEGDTREAIEERECKNKLRVQS
jgi:hypothetical protein